MSYAPLTPAQIAAAQIRDAKEGYLHRLLVALDDFGGAFLDIQNDQTISSATEIAAHKHLWYSALAKALNDGLDLIQASHGQLAQVGDIERAKAVIAVDTAALSQGQ
jgi:hypothetical protein